MKAMLAMLIISGQARKKERSCSTRREGTRKIEKTPGKRSEDKRRTEEERRKEEEEEEAQEGRL